MPRTRLIFALHFHQPYGNLDPVFADATDRCYARTIRLLAQNPHVMTALHVSGPLIDWLERHRPEILHAIRDLVGRGQVELLGGGYQEPMLAILPDRDAEGQLSRMADRCQELFGARPRGMWLAERVWEPDLARAIARAGYRFTLLDDTHLVAAGANKPLGAYYVTDKAGHAIAVVPIDRGLRVRIPFADVEPLMAYLRDAGRVVCYGDDGEKFGLWPTTERRVWHDAWLARFFAALRSEQHAVETILPSRMLAEEPSAGPVYIPTISYAEMGAWTLPPDASLAYQELAERLALAGLGSAAERFLRGGIWQAFIAKYPEANTIYRKMLRVSALVEEARVHDHVNYARARDALYQGQCNCGYWHGLFGGLYLQHLRAALFTALLTAEELVAPKTKATVERVDHDGDLADDLLFESPRINLYLAPERGGAGYELDLRGARFCLTGVFGRHREAYHVDVPRARVLSDEQLGNISAHDLVRAVEPDLDKKLVIDAYPRGAFIDHLLPAGADATRFDRDYRPLCDLPHARYRIAEVDHERVRALLRAEIAGFCLDKRVALGADLTVGYRLVSRGANESLLFASQLDVTLLSPERAGGRRIEVACDGEDPPVEPLAPGARAVHERVNKVRIACEDLGVDVTIEPSPPCTLWRLPIETVSQSERGFEASYQGTGLVFVWAASPSESEPFEAQLRLSAGHGPQPKLEPSAPRAEFLFGGGASSPASVAHSATSPSPPADGRRAAHRPGKIRAGRDDFRE